MLISVVIPCYYSQSTIRKVVVLTREELVKAGFDYEFILVNDGSTDNTFIEIEKLCKEDKNIVGINCAKNLGQHNALMAGLRKARGELVMLMDDDMQTHPSQCMKLINAIMENDVDVVFALWASKKEAAWRRFASRCATLVSRVMIERPDNVIWCNFCVMKRYIADEVIRYDGPFISIMGLINRSTSNMINVEVKHFDRETGSSGYTFKGLVKLAAASLNFSIVPLRAASLLGLILGLVGLVSAIIVVILKLTNPAMSAGWPSLMSVILICSGMIMLTQGIIGEYIGRIFITLNHAPQYIIKQLIDNRDIQMQQSID